MSDLAVREVRPTPRIRPVEQRRSWLGRNWPDLLILVVLVAVLAFLHADGMARYPARFDDEGTYMAQAWAVLERFDLSNYTYWYDHPPLGWIGLAVYLLLTGALGRAPFGVAAGRELMLILNVVGMVAIYWLARRLGIRRWLAAAAVLAYGLSPIGLFYHRMVLLDNIAIPMVLVAWALIRSTRTSLAAHTTGAVILGGAILVKETMLLFLPALAYDFWRNTDPRNRRYSLALAGTAFVGIVSLYPLFALLKGELLPGEDRVSLVGSALWQLFEREGSGSILDASSPAHAVVSGWLALDVWLPAAGLISGVMALFIPRLRAVAATLVLLALMLLRTGYLPVMFVVQALPLLALSVVGVVDQALSLADPYRRGTRIRALLQRGVTVGACALLVVGAFGQYASGVERARHVDADRPFRQAQAWLEENVDRDTLVVADHSLWLDMVLAGHPPENVIWYYKLDTDPGVELPEGGLSEYDLVVTTEIIRTTNYELPRVEEILAHSSPLVTFGEGKDRVEIKRVEVPE
ncbi:MAG: ArnT family glycosyltransferase [Actinomycetota bacterium]